MIGAIVAAVSGLTVAAIIGWNFIVTECRYLGRVDGVPLSLKYAEPLEYAEAMVKQEKQEKLCSYCGTVLSLDKEDHCKNCGAAG